MTMKNIFNIAGITLACMVGGCTLLETVKNTSYTEPPKSTVRKLSPDEVIDRKLVGSDENGNYSLLLHEDGTFIYGENESEYSGEWSFDDTMKTYRYNFTWVEGTEEKGYIMDFAVINDTLHWIGHWYLTDAFIQFQKTLSFES